MKTINLNSSDLNSTEKESIKKAFEDFDRGNYKSAYDRFFTIYNQGTDVQGIQLSIGLCLLRLNKRRQSRLFIFREILDYPNNIAALKVLNEQAQLINGQTITRKFTQTERPEKIPEISVVMIVKNEEKDLPRCLESIKDIAKEIVILDTGSTDKTVEIAQSFGARVEHFEWCNDFSIARNKSLNYASCDWILRMDADEYMEEIDKARLLHCVNSDQADVYICPMISKVKEGIQIDNNVRLFKNHLGIQFRFPIHETVIFSVRDLGLRQCLANINFQHTGYEFNEQGSSDKKIQRNISVCNQYLTQNPNDYYVRLIRDLFIANGPEKEKAYVDMEDVIKNLPEDALAVRYLGLVYLSLVQRYIEQDKEIELLKIFMDMQIDFFHDYRMMQLIGEIYLHERADWKKARKYFSWSSRGDSKNSDFEAMLSSKYYNQYESNLLLAETLVLNKEYDQSRKFFQKADKCIVELDTDQESIQESESTTQKDNRVNKLSADQLRELAKSKREIKDWQNSYKTIILAASKSQLTYQDYLNLAICQIQLRKNRLAQALLDEARQLEPKSTMVLNFESLIALNEGENEKALEKAVEAFVKEPGNQFYKSNVQEISKLNKMSPVDAIRKIGLNWINNKRTTEGLFALMMYIKFQPDDGEIKQIISKYTK